MTWSKPVTTGVVPGPRAGHTMTAVGSRLYVFGGGDGNHYLNDLHILDTETMAWSQAYVAGTSPAARSRHTTVAVGSKLYVFGGGDDTRVYNDVYILDTETMAWSRPVIKGPPPVARWGHTCTLIGEGKLVLFGGHDGTKMLTDIYILDTSIMTWSLVTPPPKNTDGQANPGPCARAGHTATLVGKKVLIFGGGDGTKILNDTWFLDPATLTWMRPTINGTAPAGRCAHTADLFDEKLVLFGGGDGSRRFKDLYILDVEQVLKAEELKRAKAKKAVKQQTQPQSPQPQQQAKKSHQDKVKNPEEVKAKDISTWLTTIGMKKFAEKFVAQEIDMEIVPFLTEVHLEQLGVNTIGARLRILQAIKALKESENETKQAELVELAHTLKESMDTLSNSTSRLTDLIKINSIHVVTTTTTSPPPSAPLLSKPQHITVLKKTKPPPVIDNAEDNEYAIE